MRVGWIAMVLAGVVGCATEVVAPSEVDQTATARQDASFLDSAAIASNADVAWGVQVHGGRAGATSGFYLIGMGGATCSFDDSGDNTGDWDTQLGGEEVQDLIDGVDGDVALVITPDAVVEVSPQDAAQAAKLRYELPGAVHARFADVGLASVRPVVGACLVDWSLAGVTYASVEVPVACERSAFAMDASSYDSFLATADGVYRVNPDGAWMVAKAASAVAWDDAGEQLLLGSEGMVRAQNSAGDTTWVAHVNGSIQQLEPIAARGELLALGTVDGQSYGWVLSLADGAVRHQGAFPTAITGVSASGDGAGLLLMSERSVHLLTLDGAW